MLLTLLPLDGYWTQVRDGDSRVAQLYMRHYSCHQYRDKRRSQYGYRNRFMVMGPGEKLVLLSLDGLAAFGWNKFIDASGQQGINCTFFRNESPILSSALILDAERHAWAKWGGYGCTPMSTPQPCAAPILATAFRWQAGTSAE